MHRKRRAYWAAGISAALVASGMAGTMRVECEMVQTMFYVQARINGSGPLWLNLDTGASHTAINPGVAQRLGLSERRGGEASGIGRGEVAGFQRVEGATMEVGTGVLRGQSMVTVSMAFLGPELGHVTDGTLGSNVFENYVVCMDYARGTVELEEPSHWSAEGAGEAVPIEVRWNMPFVKAGVRLANGQETAETFLIDTGFAGAGVSFNQAFQNAHPDVAVRAIEMPPVVTVGGTFRLRLGRVAGLKIGSFTLENLVTELPDHSDGVLADRSIAGLLGADALSRFRVTFDYRGRRMFLKPNARFHAPFESDMSGLQLRARGEGFHRFEVSGVMAHSPGSEAGIHKGDAIAEIDGRAAKEWTLGGIRETFERAGEVRRIVIERNGRERQVELRLRRLI